MSFGAGNAPSYRQELVPEIRTLPPPVCIHLSGPCPMPEGCNKTLPCGRQSSSYNAESTEFLMSSITDRRSACFKVSSFCCQQVRTRSLATCTTPNFEEERLNGHQSI